jgi:hypothetical protein
MSFLQTAGIASQASDTFDDQRQARRMNSQKEQLGQLALDKNRLYRKAMEITEANMLANRQARAAVQAPTAPGAPDAPDARGAVAYADGGGVGASKFNGVVVLADGGQASASKFNGIFDDSKGGDRLPTIYREFLEDLKRPGYKHGGSVEHTVRNLVGHINAYADGGEVLSPDDEATRRRIEEGEVFGAGMGKSTKAVMPTSPADLGSQYTPNPTDIYGRLLNSSAYFEPRAPAPARAPAPGGDSFGLSDTDPTGTGTDTAPATAPAPSPSNDDNDGISGVGSIATGVVTGNVAQTVLGLAQAAYSVIANDFNAIIDAVTGMNQAPAAPSISNTDDTDTGVGAAADGAAAGADGDGTGSGGVGGGGGTGDGDGGSGGWADGGPVTLWGYMKHKMGAKKAKPKGAVKMKKMKKGGFVRGPGTGTSDSVKATIGGKHPARLSDGEYVLSADTVAAVGKHNLDALQAKYHRPVR